MISRRRLLQYGTSGGLAVVAGCSHIQTDDTKPLRVSVVNGTVESHFVSLSVFTDTGDPLVEQEIEIAAAKPNDGTEIHTVLQTEPYPETGTFQVESALDGDIARENTVRIRCGEEFNGINIIIRIHVGPEMSIGDSCF